MNEQIIFLIFAIVILGILLWQVCKRGNLSYKLLFFFVLIILSAFYLFQFGELGSFIFSSKWADVKFIKEKREEARQDAEEISQIKNQIQKIFEDSRHSQEIIIETQKRILSLEKDLQNFKDKYDSEVKKLAKEVEYLKNRNEVLKLSDAAVATGDAEPFEKLEKIYILSTDKEIKMAALSQIFRVKNHFATMTRIKGVDVTYTHPQTGKEFIENEVPTEALIQGLKEAKYWKVRARIAELLKERKEKQVPEALLETIKNDKKLEVRKKALDSFESVTGFASRDVLRYTPAKEWWEENKLNVEKDLEDLQTVEEVIKKNSEN